MKYFHYKKWFFDVFTEEGAYLILFVSTIKTGWKRYAYLQVYSTENKDNSGYMNQITFEIPLHFTKETSQGIQFHEGRINFIETTLELQFQTKEFTCHLDFNSNEKNDRNPLQLNLHRNSVLEWKPLGLKRLVNGILQVEDQGKYQFFSETGYSDLVESTIFPLNVPVRKLYWGRIHHAACDVSWSFIKGRDGKTFSKLFLSFDNRNYEFDTIELVIKKQKTGIKQPVLFPEIYALKVKSKNLSMIIDIFSHEEILGNDFMKYAEKYGKIPGKLIRYFSRNPRGIKFRAMATIKIFTPGKRTWFENLPLIDEFVRFAD